MKLLFLTIALVACGRTELESLPGDGTNIGVPGGGASNLPPQTAIGGRVAASGGAQAASTPSGGTSLGSTTVVCPPVVPLAAAPCTTKAVCNYVTATRPCCEETAQAICNGMQWAVKETDCDCFNTGGAYGTGGASTIGGSFVGGGTSSSGGANPVGGTRFGGGTTSTTALTGCSQDSVVKVAKSCDLLLTADPALLQLEGTDPFTSTVLGLARANQSGSCSSVVTTKISSSTDLPELVGVTFQPWSAGHWPQSGQLGPTTSIPLPNVPTGLFAVGASNDRKLSLAWQLATGGVKFGWDVDIDTFVGTYREVSSADTLNTVSTSSIGHLVTTYGRWFQSLQLWSDDDLSYTNFQGACASTDVLIGTEPYKKGFAWATSTGANNEVWGCPAYAHQVDFGAASRVDVGVITDNCCESPISNFDVGDTIVALKTAPHDKGLWILWQTAADNPPVIHYLLQGVEPPQVITSGTLGSDKAVPVDFATAAIGNRLIVAWSNAVTSTIVLSMLDESGPRETSVANLTPPSLHGLSLLAGPYNSGVLLGFPNGYVARFDCAEFE